MKCQYAKLNRGRNDPLLIEKRRDKFARLKEYKELVKAYSSDLPEVEDENTGEFWDSLNKKNIIGDNKNPMANHRIEIVSHLIPNKAKVLDIGFGSLALEKKLKKSRKEFNLYGLDISDFSVREARKTFPEWIFKKGSILDIPFKNGSVDYVLALEVLEHIRPSCVLKALAEIRRVLTNNGFLVVSVPLNEGLRQLMKERRNPNAHVREYTPNIIRAELELTGFSVMKIKSLFAFHKNYSIKSFIAKFIFSGIRSPNNLIIVAQKK